MYWLIRKGVNADCASGFFENKKYMDMISRFDFTTGLSIKLNSVKLKKHEVPHIVSESRMRDGSRQDLFNLDTGERIEVISSCDKSVVPYDDKTVIVKV